MPLKPDPLPAEDRRGDAARSMIPRRSALVPTRGSLLAMAMLFYQGYVSAISPIASPVGREQFRPAINPPSPRCSRGSRSPISARSALSRMADKAGRRRVMLLSMTAMPLCALGAAIVDSSRLFRPVRHPSQRLRRRVLASAIVIVAEVLPIRAARKGRAMRASRWPRVTASL